MTHYHVQACAWALGSANVNLAPRLQTECDRNAAAAVQHSGKPNESDDDFDEDKMIKLKFE